MVTRALPASEYLDGGATHTHAAADADASFDPCVMLAQIASFLQDSFGIPKKYMQVTQALK